MMKNKLILLFALGLCAQVQAQVPHLSRETYRERVEAYSQVLKQPVSYTHLSSIMNISTGKPSVATSGFTNPEPYTNLLFRLSCMPFWLHG